MQTPNKLNVLIVDDDAITVEVIKMLLVENGCEATTVYTCENAIQLTSTSNPRFDVLICDMSLPDGNGIELVSKIGKNIALRRIAISGHSDDQSMNAASSAGFDEYFVKPLNLDDIVAAVLKPAK